MKSTETCETENSKCANKNSSLRENQALKANPSTKIEFVIISFEPEHNSYAITLSFEII